MCPQVVYDDGDQEDIIIGTDIPVKVRCYSNECLPTPSAQQLERLSSLLLQQAENDDAAAKAASGPSDRRKKHAAGDLIALVLIVEQRVVRTVSLHPRYSSICQLLLTHVSRCMWQLLDTYSPTLSGSIVTSFTNQTCSVLCYFS